MTETQTQTSWIGAGVEELPREIYEKYCRLIQAGDPESVSVALAISGKARVHAERVKHLLDQIDGRLKARSATEAAVPKIADMEQKIEALQTIR